MERKWLKYDILTVMKQVFGIGVFVSGIIGMPWIILGNGMDIAYIIVFILVWSIVFVFLILPVLRYKTLWKGEGKFNDYRLIRRIGKFSLIKDGVFGNFQIIEDKDKDGIPDSKDEKHFMGRFGYSTYTAKLEDIDYQAFNEAMESIQE